MLSAGQWHTGTLRYNIVICFPVLRKQNNTEAHTQPKVVSVKDMGKIERFQRRFNLFRKRAGGSSIRMDMGQYGKLIAFVPDQDRIFRKSLF